MTTNNTEIEKLRSDYMGLCYENDEINRKWAEDNERHSHICFEQQEEIKRLKEKLDNIVDDYCNFWSEEEVKHLGTGRTPEQEKDFIVYNRVEDQLISDTYRGVIRQLQDWYKEEEEKVEKLEEENNKLEEENETLKQCLDELFEAEFAIDLLEHHEDMGVSKIEAYPVWTDIMVSAIKNWWSSQ